MGMFYNIYYSLCNSKEKKAITSALLQFFQQ